MKVLPPMPAIAQMASPAVRQNRRTTLAELRQHVCGPCQARQGELHDLYCDMERCPFCGGQLSSCGCSNRHFYPDTYNEEMDASFNPVVPFFGLPEEVYSNGLSDAQETEWRRILEEKGRVPFIFYPNLCSHCGELWPAMFRVSDEEWEHYIEPRMRRTMICWPCYCWIKVQVDRAQGDA